jgi:hypothetical protein
LEQDLSTGTRKDIDMAQHDMLLNNNPGLTFRTDANGALAALVSVNSGPTEPGTKYAGMLWLDTSVLPDGALRMRNQANTAWVPLVFGEIPTTIGSGAGTVMTTGNAFYTGTDPANVSFPVGTVLMVKGTASAGRGSTLAVKLSATAGLFDLAGTTALSGTWRHRGQMGAASDWTYLAQRVS